MPLKRPVALHRRWLSLRRSLILGAFDFNLLLSLFTFRRRISSTVDKILQLLHRVSDTGELALQSVSVRRNIRNLAAALEMTDEDIFKRVISSRWAVGQQHR